MAVKTSNRLVEMAQSLDQQRLKKIVQGLVISLGYLEHWLERGGDNAFIHTAASSLDVAIDALNDYLDQA
jgi:hypothetical protein